MVVSLAVAFLMHCECLHYCHCYFQTHKHAVCTLCIFLDFEHLIIMCIVCSRSFSLNDLLVHYSSNCMIIKNITLQSLPSYEDVKSKVAAA